MRGAIFESWVAAEIFKARAHAGKPAAMYRYREVRGPEVDIVVEASRALLLVEAKSGATLAEDYFAGLRALEERLSGARERRPRKKSVIFGGATAQRRSKVSALPWSQIQEESWV